MDNFSSNHRVDVDSLLDEMDHLFEALQPRYISGIQNTSDVIHKSIPNKIANMNHVNIDKLVVDFATNGRDHLIQELVREEEYVYTKSPSEIAGNPNEQKRREDLYLFQLLDELYTAPLYELANRLSLSLYQKPATFSNLADVSIRNRIITIRNFLKKNGVTIKEMEKLLPISEEDFLVLSQAYKKGFLVGNYNQVNDLSNESRVTRAKEFLEKQDTNTYGGRTV